MRYERLARPVLFRVGHGDAEAAHTATLSALERVGRRRAARAALRAVAGSQGTPRDVFGVRFPGPVGLAAGMDKDGRALRAWPALGFGFVEVGTVTAVPQQGNDRPRLFRLPASEAIINRMGFNNAGATALAARLRAAGPPGVPVGISIGKSKATPLGEAVEDYLACLRALEGLGDYIALNVSSPNTPGLRSLQDPAALAGLLAALRATTRTPILVKIAPDLADGAIAELLGVCLDTGVSGLIATNTTLSREGLAAADAARAAQAGGLSGHPLAARAREVVAFAAKHTGGALPIIGVGGICTAADARAMVDAGAALVQVYSGLIYHGPRLVAEINKALA